MKTEQRKELQQNSLMQFYHRMVGNLRAGPSRKAVVIGSILVLALIAFAGYRFFASRSLTKNSARWTVLSLSSSLDDPELKEFVETNRGTPPANVLELQQANNNLNTGLTELDVHRTDSLEKLKKAAEAYERLEKEFKAVPVVVQECLQGAAKAYEARGERTKALEMYQKLKDRFPKSPLTKMSESSMQRLASEKEFNEVKDAVEKLIDTPSGNPK